jgi:HEPN domain-containing protein
MVFGEFSPEPFGSHVETQFPSAIYDIEEATKCLALGRATATAFHAMRAIEIGVRALARCLSIPDPLKPADRNWGSVLKAIKDEIERRWPTSASRHGGDGQVIETLFASLDAMKNPWRNPTMHVEAKYTEEEAEHIMLSAAGFMRALAMRCDEDGNPKA